MRLSRPKVLFCSPRTVDKILLNLHEYPFVHTVRRSAFGLYDNPRRFAPICAALNKRERDPAVVGTSKKNICLCLFGLDVKTYAGHLIRCL
ncbi:unnamed protein product [Acanthoscelides obtectus]|uniref:Uncharacterized protein n=1 Tax=Acanthoscelides obtectus TaxID=200917 RepID=A0A9P0KK19_ACAOB|nr:unnamed protein product [Acanthoscelides obtectus]CAK1668807.1 hypothetical protein AOBTE_LOCUS26616 [Acanthoscelides obtectus]